MSSASNLPGIHPANTRSHTLTTAQAVQWRALVPMAVSVTGSVEYLRLCEAQTGGEARLFVVEGSGPLVAYPYLMRSIDSLPFAPEALKGYCDINSPEYRGPLALPGAPADELAALNFPEIFAQHCRAGRIVAEFGHLNPWSGVTAFVPSECVHEDRDIVYLDLTRDMEELWMQSFSSDARRQTRQGHRAGVTVRRAQSVEDVLEFHRLHELTMHRRQALDRYFHSREYFVRYFETMPENAFFLLAELGGRAIAGGLFMHDREEMYWHLSAADMEYSHVRPVNVYLHQAIAEWAGSGVKRLVMGGAYGAGDGVFRFKANFSPLRARFSTFRRVHDAAVCDALAEAWCEHHGGAAVPSGYFPPYRAIPMAPVLMPG